MSAQEPEPCSAWSTSVFWRAAQQLNGLPFPLPPALYPGDQCELQIRIANPWWSEAQLSFTGAVLQSCSVETQPLPQEGAQLPQLLDELPSPSATRSDSDMARIEGPLRLAPGCVSLLKLTLLEAEAPSALLRVLLQSGPNRTQLCHEVQVRRGRIGRVQCQPLFPTLEQSVSLTLEQMLLLVSRGPQSGLRLLEESLTSLAQLRQSDGGWGWLPETPTDTGLTARFVLLLSLPSVPLTLQRLRIDTLAPAAQYLENQLPLTSPFGSAEELASIMAALGAFRRLHGPVQSTTRESRSLAMLFSRAPKGSVTLQALLAVAAWYHQEHSIAEQVLRWMPVPDISPEAHRFSLLHLLALTLVQARAERTQSLRIRLLSLEEDERLLGAEVRALQRVVQALVPPRMGETTVQSAQLNPAVTLRTEGVLLKVLMDCPSSAQHSPEGTAGPQPAPRVESPVSHLISRGNPLGITVHLFVPASLERVLLVVTPAAGLVPGRIPVDTHLQELPLADLGETWSSLWVTRAELSPELLEEHFSRISPNLEIAHTARWIPLVTRWGEGRLLLAIPRLPLGLWRLRLRFRACWPGTFLMPPAVLWSEAIPWMEVTSQPVRLHIHEQGASW